MNEELKNKFKNGMVPDEVAFGQLIDEATKETDLSGYATKEEIPVVPDVSNFITLEDIPETDLSEYAKVSDIPSLDGLLNQTAAETLYVRKDALPNFEEYAKKTDIPAPQDLSHLATKSEIPDVSSFITLEDIPPTDLSEYAKVADIPSLDGLLSSANAELLYVKKSELPDFNSFANKSEIPDISGLATKEEIPTVPDVSQFITLDEVPEVDLTPYATTEMVKDIQVTPKDFGAVGDGVSDDTQALREFFSSQHTRKHVDAGTYLITDSLEFELESNRITSDGLIVSDLVDSTVISITGNDNYISLNINGNNKASTGIYCVGENNEISDSILGNFQGEGKSAIAIKIIPNGFTRVSNNRIFKVHATGDEIRGNMIGASRAIHSEIVNFKPTDRTYISNNDISNITGEEGDAIQIISTQVDNQWTPSNTHIFGNSMREMTRRGIKIQASTVYIYDNFIEENISNYTNPVRAIDIQYSSNVSAKRNIIKTLNMSGIGITGREEGVLTNVSIMDNTIEVLGEGKSMYCTYVSESHISNNTFIGGTGLGFNHSNKVIIHKNTFKNGLDTPSAITIMSDNERMIVTDNTLISGEYHYFIQNHSPNSIVTGNHSFTDGVIRTYDTATNSIYKDNSGENPNISINGNLDNQYVSDFVNRHSNKNTVAPPLINMNQSPREVVGVYYRSGQIVLNKNVNTSGIVGWICVASGSPGIWQDIKSSPPS